MRKLALIILLCGSAFGQVPTNQRALSLPAFVPNYNIPGRPLLSGLHISVGTGTLLINGIPTTYAATTLTMTDNTTNYVYVDLGTGLLTQNITGFTSQDYPICTAVAVGGIIVTLTDSRPDIFGSTAVGLLDPGGNGLIFRSSFNVTRVATSSDIVALFSGSCDSSHALFGDGTCKAISTSFSSLTTGANTQANMQVSTGATVAPLNLGQVASSQAWVAGGLVAPSTTGTLTGGLITPASTWSIQYTLNTAAGETPPSIPVSGSTQTLSSSVCNSGSSCTLTITAPTLGAYSSWNAYVCTTSAGPCTVPQKLASCTAITGNCVITASQGGNTSGVPTVNTAWTQPPNVQANNSYYGTIPSWFFPKTDGNYYPWVSVDFKTDPIGSGAVGTPVFSHRTYFSDTSTAPFGTLQSYKNAFVSINHLLGTGTTSTNQDRALAIQISGPASDSATRWGWEAIQAEADWVGTAQSTGSPDGEITSGSFQTSDSHTGSIGNPALGVNGVRVSVDRSSSGTTGSCRDGVCYAGVRSEVYNNNNSSMSGLAYAAFVGSVYSNTGTPADISYDFVAAAPSSHGNRFSGLNAGLKVFDFGTNTADWNILSSSTNGTPTSGRNWFGGNVYLPNILTAANTVSVTGAIADTGSLSAAQLATPTAPTVSVVGGGSGTTYTYGFVGKDGNGNSTPISSTSNGNNAATLDGSHSNNVCLGGSATNVTNGYSSVDVYRTVSGGTPSSTGKIGTITVTNTTLGGGSFCLSDTGLAGDSTTAPTINTTGGVKAYNVQTLSNCAAVGSAASPSVAACGSASAGHFSCATNATGATCTVNTTAVTANSEIFVSESDTATTGTALGVTCNTSTTVVPTSRLLASSVAGTSFTINLGTVTTNPACFSYFLVN